PRPRVRGRLPENRRSKGAGEGHERRRGDRHLLALRRRRVDRGVRRRVPEGSRMTTADLLRSSWTFRPVVLLACAAALAWHAAMGGLRSARRTSALLAAMAILFLALSSPLDALAAGYLFSAHMLQHLLLVLVVPALALMALPAAQGSPSAWADGAARWVLSRPVV